MNKTLVAANIAKTRVGKSGRLPAVALVTLLLLAAPARADELATLPDAVAAEHDACIPVPATGVDHPPSAHEILPGLLMDEPALATVRGRGADGAELNPDVSVAVILWDEPGCTGCRSEQSISHAAGTGNFQKTSLMVNRP